MPSKTPSEFSYFNRVGKAEAYRDQMLGQDEDTPTTKDMAIDAESEVLASEEDWESAGVDPKTRLVPPSRPIRT